MYRSNPTLGTQDCSRIHRRQESPKGKFEGRNTEVKFVKFTQKCNMKALHYKSNSGYELRPNTNQKNLLILVNLLEYIWYI